MTSVDFLSPDRARGDLGFTPVLRSAMERRQRDAGATFAERDGWLLPVSLPHEARHLGNVGVADLSHLGKIEARGHGDPEPGVTAWYAIRPDLHLVLCEYTACADVRARLAGRFELVLDQTGALSIVALVGPKASDALRRLTHLHTFPASGPVGHVPGHVLERDGGFWLVFPQEYGHYLWEVAVDAAEQLGGGPVGVDALAGGAA
jgi:glycine cleavage system aminomethyltransferase T